MRKTVIDFLREKGILDDKATKWIVEFADGREYDIVKLVEEFAGHTPPELRLKNLLIRRDMVMADIVSDDWHDSLHRFRNDCLLFFEQQPEFNTDIVREKLGFKPRPKFNQG